MDNSSLLLIAYMNSPKQSEVVISDHTMSDNTKVEMNISVNGESKVPPGFRFHPTEEELLLYYLAKKVASQSIDLDVIREVDLNKLEPWDIQEKCKIGSGPQNDWYFFSHKDKKYPTGTRTNRATAAGFWKATGRDKVINSSFKRIGMRKTLVFYKGRAPHGLKSDWIMHEYRLQDHSSNDINIVNNLAGDSGCEEGWVVCRVFKKKNYLKALESPQGSTSSNAKHQILNQTNDVILGQILHYMGKSCKQENGQANNNIMLHNFPSFNPNYPKHSNLPRLEHVSALNEIQPSDIDQVNVYSANNNVDDDTNNNNRVNDWVALDRLVASQLNGQDNNAPTHFSCYNDLHDDLSFAQIHHDFQLSNKSNFQLQDSQVYSNDLWRCFSQSLPLSSSSDPLADLSV